MGKPQSIPVSNEASQHFAIPDALRAFAILIVVIHHLVSFSHVTLRHHRIPTDYLGVWGVNMFFLLSGFLLTAAYLGAIFDGRPFPSTRSFLIRRFLRIYPLYIVVVLAEVGLVGAFLHPVSGSTVLRHAFMLQAASVDDVSAVNFPLWTMGVDVCFYFALPAFMAIAFAITRTFDRPAKIRAILAALAAIVIASTAFRYFQTIHTLGVISDYKLSTVYVRNFLGMGTSFSLGIAIALLRNEVPYNRFAPSLYQWVFRAGVALGIVALVTTPLIHGTLREVMDDPIAACSGALILYGLMQGGSPSISRFASSRGVAFAATLAYAVYLIHSPILEVVWVRIIHRKPGPVALLELLLAFVAVIIPLAIAANRFVEEPCLQLKDRFRTPSAPLRESTG